MFSRAYVEITNVCNLACAFCPGTAREKRFMTPETFALLAGKLRPHTDFLYLHVMGEPLLHPQLAEILHICEELGFRVCLTTNGTLLPEKLPLLLESPAIHKVSVSLHSFEGNGRSDGLEEYVERVADSCLSLAGGGVICALRLWNQGGRGRGKFPDTSCFGPHDEEEYGDPAKRPPRQPQAGGKSLSGGGGEVRLARPPAGPAGYPVLLRSAPADRRAV